MAKKKQATPVLELEKTLVVDDTIYNVNAVHSDSSDQATEAAHALKADHALVTDEAECAKKVNEKFTINEIGTGNTNVVEYDGSTAKSIDIVPASGGQFSGKIIVPNLEADADLNANGGAVLNYNDVVTRVVDKLINTSTMATWDGEAGQLIFNDLAPAVNGLCVVKGKEASVLNFSKANESSKWLPDYLYVCTDTGNIYLGNSESNTTIQLAVSAVSATKLATPRDIKIDLASTEAASFDGTAVVSPGVKGVLSVTNGGTGATKPATARANLGITPVNIGAASAEHTHIDLTAANNSGIVSLRHTSNSTTGGTDYYLRPDKVDGSNDRFMLGSTPNPWDAAFIGKLTLTEQPLTVANGGTGKNDLKDVKVGAATQADSADSATKDDKGNIISSYYQKNITISPNAPSGGSNGDIWIKY